MHDSSQPSTADRHRSANNAQGRAPIGPNSGEPNPEKSIARSQSQATVFAQAAAGGLMTETDSVGEWKTNKSYRQFYRQLALPQATTNDL